MTCDHGDHIVCNECDTPRKKLVNKYPHIPLWEQHFVNEVMGKKPAGDVTQVHLDQKQLHADDYVDKNYELPKELFCKCEHGTPCFDTCFELEKYIQGERNRSYQQGYNDAKGNHD